MTEPDFKPLPDGLREKIARAIHDRYRQHQSGRKPATDPAMQPWENLTETLRESNRAQAADLGAKLQAIGYRIAPASSATPPLTFTPEEFERLAILEHERWVTERLQAGWTQGPVRDVERKITPYLVSWEELAEEIREYDREAVRVIPELLAEAGLAAVRA